MNKKEKEPDFNEIDERLAAGWYVYMICAYDMCIVVKERDI